MISKKMPRQFWSYTAGKGSARAEAREAAREETLQAWRQTIPGRPGLWRGVLLTLLHVAHGYLLNFGVFICLPDPRALDYTLTLAWRCRRANVYCQEETAEGILCPELDNIRLNKYISMYRTPAHLWAHMCLSIIGLWSLWH